MPVGRYLHRPAHHPLRRQLARPGAVERRAGQPDPHPVALRADLVRLRGERGQCRGGEPVVARSGQHPQSDLGGDRRHPRHVNAPQKGLVVAPPQPHSPPPGVSSPPPGAPFPPAKVSGPPPDSRSVARAPRTGQTAIPPRTERSVRPPAVGAPTVNRSPWMSWIGPCMNLSRPDTETGHGAPASATVAAWWNCASKFPKVISRHA